MRRHSPQVFVLFSFVVALLAQAVWAQERGPSTAEERAKAVALAQYLEEQPFGDKAVDARRWLIMWWAAIPDMSVTLCGDLLGPVVGSKYKYAAELTTQMLFSGGAFVILHRDSAPDEEAVYLAGVEGAVRCYEAILLKQPKRHHPFLDDLVKRRRDGTLAAYVHEAMAKCKS